MFTLYRIILYALVPFILLKLWLRSLRAPAYRKRINERFGFIDIRPEAGGIWVHAVSVGEAIAAIKLIKALQQHYPQHDVTVTCGTPTGSAVIRQQLGDSVFHVYLPYDLPGAVKRFMRRVRPSVGIIMETEIWPNLLRYADQSGVWLLLSNMRLSETSFRRYGRVSALIHQSLACLDSIAAQSEADAERIRKLGARPESVQVVGNLKFEMAPSGKGNDSVQAALRKQFATGRTLWVAGSTHEGEDEQVLKVHQALLAQDAALLLLLAPRHPERFESVSQLCREKFKLQRRSELKPGQAPAVDTQIVLLDSIGELDQFIQLADWAFIGGSLVPVGGHNILEACQAGVPVLYGRHMHNFKQIAQIVEQQGAGLCVQDQSAFLAASQMLLNDAFKRQSMGSKGRELVIENQGALDKTLALLAPHLSSYK